MQNNDSTIYLGRIIHTYICTITTVQYILADLCIFKLYILTAGIYKKRILGFKLILKLAQTVKFFEDHAKRLNDPNPNICGMHHPLPRTLELNI